MKPTRLLGFAAVLTLVPARAQDTFDQLEQTLTFSALHDQARAKFSGTIDAEYYQLETPAPGLLHTADHGLFSPRLTTFLDAQWGTQAYFFAQARADRGFDPGDRGVQVRLDEYALRVTPWEDGRLNFQAGKFATIVGNWAPRHDSWTNPFVTAPLPYENLTGIWDVEPLHSTNTLLQWAHIRPGLPAGLTAREKFLRLPIIWGPSYATGIALSGISGRLLYAVEVKHAALSSRPEAWARTRDAWRHPTVSGRVAWRPNPAWTFGVSASEGTYLRPFAQDAVRPPFGLGDYRQEVLGQDISFAWHHLQVWTEVYASRFAIPAVGNAETVAYYIETKYKFTPQWFGAVRWNQQTYNRLADRGTAVRWGRDVARIDVAAGYRFTPHLQLKLQYNLQRGDVEPRRYGQLMAAQFTLRY
jgi:hypothetical protein